MEPCNFFTRNFKTEMNGISFKRERERETDTFKNALAEKQMLEMEKVRNINSG